MILPCLSYAGLQVCMDSHWTPQNLSTLIRTRTIYKIQIKTAVAYFHHDKIGGKSVGSGMVRPSPTTTSGHWCGRPAHDAVSGSTVDLSLLNNLSVKIVNLPPNWRHLRLFLPSSTPPTVSYTSCTPLWTKNQWLLIKTKNLKNDLTSLRLPSLLQSAFHRCCSYVLRPPWGKWVDHPGNHYHYEYFTTSKFFHTRFLVQKCKLQFIK